MYMRRDTTNNSTLCPNLSTEDSAREQISESGRLSGPPVLGGEAFGVRFFVEPGNGDGDAVDGVL